MSESLRQSINDFQAGNLEAFTYIYQNQYNHVYYIALQYTKDDSRAQDIAQEVFIEIYKSLGSLTKSENFNAWLNKIVYSFFIKSIRSKQEEMRVHLSETTNLEEVIPSEGSDDPREIYEKQELLDAIELSFNELTTVQQEVARMRFHDELSINEISDILAIPEGTVKSRINSIRILLQNSLQGEYKQYRSQLAPVMYLFFSGLISNVEVLKTHNVSSDVAAIAAAGSLKHAPRIHKPKITTIGVGAAIIGIPLLVSGINDTEVIVQELEYQQAWTNENLEVEIQLDKAIDDLFITLDDVPLNIDTKDRNYRVEVSSNGTLSLYHDTKLIRTEAITNIDKEVPTLELSQEGNRLRISFYDSQSGIDMSSLTVSDNDGNNIPFQIKDNTIEYEKNNDEHDQIRGSDFAGNTFDRKVIRSE